MKINTVHGNVIVTQPEKKIERLPVAVDALSIENADLIFQNAMQDVTLQSLQDENAELLFRMANIELGGVL